MFFAPTPTRRVGVREMECKEIQDLGKGKISVAGVRAKCLENTGEVRNCKRNKGTGEER